MQARNYCKPFGPICGTLQGPSCARQTFVLDSYCMKKELTIKEWLALRDKELLTSGEVISVLRKEQGEKKTKEYAEEFGVSRQWLEAVYSGKFEPGASIVKQLGFKRVTMYEAVK